MLSPRLFASLKLWCLSLKTFRRYLVFTILCHLKQPRNLLQLENFCFYPMHTRPYFKTVLIIEVIGFVVEFWEQGNKCCYRVPLPWLLLILVWRQGSKWVAVKAKRIYSENLGYNACSTNWHITGSMVQVLRQAFLADTSKRSLITLSVRILRLHEVKGWSKTHIFVLP